MTFYAHIIVTQFSLSTLSTAACMQIAHNIAQTKIIQLPELHYQHINIYSCSNMLLSEDSSAKTILFRY